MTDFTPEQKNYLQGLTLGMDVARHVLGLPVLSGSAAPGTSIRVGGQASAAPATASSTLDSWQRAAQDRFLAEGKRLAKEEEAKRAQQPFELWDTMVANADAGKFPSGSDIFLYKYHGLFYVTPAQDAFMTRLRFAGGVVKSYQFRGLADLADQFAGGYADVTTRANLQLREIPARHAMQIVNGLTELGILNRGSGADNIRNVTASPTSGLDPQELIETYPLAKEMHYYILNHKEMYELPRKFNIAFDGGGVVSSLDDTNDIGFHAVRVSTENATAEVPAGIYFQLTLGGITGHQDFARDTGVLLKPDECVRAAAALVRVFIEHGDRTDRKKARLKYLLDAWGFEKFLAETAKHLPFAWRRFAIEKCDARPSEDRLAHVGVHRQKQADRNYVGVVLPVGRLTSDQLRGLAALSERYGSSELRLTVWQNLLLTDIHDADLDDVKQAIEELGLDWQATSLRAGLVACTGNTGCKFAAANTKGQAMIIARHLEQHLTIDTPINIHLTGCHHSCAQHYIGDIGLIATKVAQGDDMLEGFHIFVGGGWGERQAIGRELFNSVTCERIPSLLEQLLRGYLERRTAAESFADFARRHSIEQLRGFVAQELVAA
ncbi:MAG TPA: NirA family protein [Pirellulaceae bacterium]|nr:NirA family protein [Pirellulaceae bacterium]